MVKGFRQKKWVRQGALLLEVMIALCILVGFVSCIGYYKYELEQRILRYKRELLTCVACDAVLEHTREGSQEGLNIERVPITAPLLNGDPLFLNLVQGIYLVHVFQKEKNEYPLMSTIQVDEA